MRVIEPAVPPCEFLRWELAPPVRLKLLFALMQEFPYRCHRAVIFADERDGSHAIIDRSEPVLQLFQCFEALLHFAPIERRKQFECVAEALGTEAELVQGL